MRPIYIVGCPRSGTTLLRLILTSHSRICIPHEFKIFEVVSSFYSENNTLGLETIDQLVENLYSYKHFNDWGIERQSLKADLCQCDGSKAEIINSIYIAYAKTQNKGGVIWGDKYIKTIGVLDEVRQTFPSARFVHLVRDPRDVFSSFRSRGWRSYVLKGFYNTRDYLEISRLWNDTNQTVLSFAEKTPNSVFTLKYEDLTQHPQDVVERICNFLDLDFESSMLEYHKRKDATKLIPPERRDAFHENTSKPIIKNNSNKYHDLLTTKQLAYFNYNSSSLMEQFGYESSIPELKSNFPYRLEKVKSFTRRHARKSYLGIQKTLRNAVRNSK